MAEVAENEKAGSCCGGYAAYRHELCLPSLKNADRHVLRCGMLPLLTVHLDGALDINSWYAFAGADNNNPTQQADCSRNPAQSLCARCAQLYRHSDLILPHSRLVHHLALLHFQCYSARHTICTRVRPYFVSIPTLFAVIPRTNTHHHSTVACVSE
jgi:hypothetical protein